MKRTAVVYDKWLHQFGGAEMVACRMANILQEKGWDVTFVSGKYVHLHKIKDKFGIDLGQIPFYQVWNHENHLRKLVEGKDLFINLSFMDYSYGWAKKNIYYTHFPTAVRGAFFNIPLEFFHITGLHILLPRPYRDRIYNRIRAGVFFDMRKRLASYDEILANSEFTRKWIMKYWNMDSKVLYPPVDLFYHCQEAPLARTKQSQGDRLASARGDRRNWIASLGRFFTLGHGKKQEILIEAFRKLHDAGHKNWELHLMGGVGEESSSIAFVEELKAMAKGYPVFFHLNAPQEEIRQVLAQSRIYWHATGYGENEETNPMAFEHFGIAPVEAIEAGCIPVLYDGGGLREIIAKLDYSKELHLFRTITELVDKTNNLIKNPLIDTLDENILEKTFSLKIFKNNFLSFAS